MCVGERDSYVGHDSLRENFVQTKQCKLLLTPEMFGMQFTNYYR